MIATASKPIRKRRQTRARRCTFKNAYTRFFTRVQYGPNLYAGYYAMGVQVDPDGTYIPVESGTCPKNTGPCTPIIWVGNTYVTQDWEACNKIDEAAMWFGISAVSIPLIKNPIVSALAAAAIGPNCKCEMKLRYKEYRFREWKGKYKLRWSLIQGWMANYWLASVGPVETGAYDVQWKYRIRFDAGEGWDIESGWDQHPLFPKELSITPNTQLPTAGLTSGEWSGWMKMETE